MRRSAGMRKEKLGAPVLQNTPTLIVQQEAAADV